MSLSLLLVSDALLALQESLEVSLRVISDILENVRLRAERKRRAVSLSVVHRA